MKALVLKEYNKDLYLENVKDPEAGYSDIIMQVKACGMCYTDVKIVTGKLAHFINLPHIPGHEIAGEVVAVGKGVKHLRAGQKGIAYFLIGCRDCEMCRTGRENLCYNIQRLGFELSGGYAQYVKLPAYNFCAFNTDTPFTEMAILPDAIATPYHALNKMADLRMGQSLLIVGAGGLGLHAVQIARKMGAFIAVCDISNEALALAESFGAELLINVRTEDPYQKIMDYSKGLGVDVVLQGVGKKETIKWSLPSLKKGGILIIMGYDPLNPLPISAIDMHNNQWRIAGTKVSNKQELMEVISLTERKIIKPVVQKEIIMEKVNSGLEEIRQGAAIGRTVINMS